MEPEAWQAIAAIAGTVGATVSAIAVAMISRTKTEARKATEAARQARDNTKPISNGYARKTTAALEELARRSRAHEARLTWLTDALGQHLTLHHVDDSAARRDRQPPRQPPRQRQGQPGAWWPPDADAGVLFGFGDLTADDEAEGGDGTDGDDWGISAG